MWLLESVSFWIHEYFLKTAHEKSTLWVYLHYTPWLVVAATKSHRVLCEQQRSKAAQVVHTHQTSCRGGWPRGFGELNSSPHSWIFTPVSVGSSPHSYLFTSVTGRIGVHCTKVWHKTYPICDAPLSRSAGPAQLRPVTEIALPQPFLCVERCPFWHDAVVQNLSGIVHWRIQGRGPRGPPPPPPLFLSGIILVVAQNLSGIVSFWTLPK